MHECPVTGNGNAALMGLLRRLFGPAFDADPSEPSAHAGHVHARDADPDDVVLPKQNKSSRSLLAGKPPLGWKRQALEQSGGVWPWGGGEGGGWP